MQRAYRLQKARDFESVFKRGAGLGQGGLFLKMRPTALAQSRFGIVVSKKTAASAVRRNRIRRLLREAIRAHAKQLKKGVDVVLVVQPSFQAQNLAGVQAVVTRLFQRASLFI